MFSLLGVSTSWSQGIFESSWILPEEGRANKVFVNLHFVTGVSVEFGNLGEISFLDSDLEDLLLEFDDGFIKLSQADSAITSAYSFLERNATLNDDGDVESFTLSRFRTESLGTSLEKDIDMAPGWELGANYDIWKLTNRITTGFTAAVGFSAIRAEHRDTIQARLIRERAIVDLSEPLPGIIGNNGDFTQGSGPQLNINDIRFEGQTGVFQMINGELVEVLTDVRGVYEIEAAMGTVRLGPYLDIQLTDRLFLYVGFGFTGAYLSSDFTVSQSFSVPTTGRDRLVSETVSDGQWLIGGYAEINLLYKINEQTSIYAGAQSHFLSDFDTQTNNDTFAEIDISKPTYLQMGFELDF